VGRLFLGRLRPYPCYGGLDLAAVNDLTSFVLCWPIESRLYMHPWFWIPEEGIAQRAKKDNVPYAEWARNGYVETTPGAETDWRFVTERIKQLAGLFDIRQIGYDRYGARDTKADLEDFGLDMAELAQGPLSRNAPMRRIASAVRSQTLVHSGHPVLRWNIDCATVTQDANENLNIVKPNRQAGSKRIDGVVAAIMAVDCAMKQIDQTIRYVPYGVESESRRDGVDE
jgi:phage terminase large subunit-like protein